MPHVTLISASDLQRLMDGPVPLVVLDCGFDLVDPTAGARSHDAGRVPRSRHIDLNRDLAGTPNGHNGRHPLPDRDAFSATVGRLGVTPETQVVVYDQQGGPYAARAWWLLRWLGHRAVAVLDGGLAAWKSAGGAVESGSATDRGPAQAAPYPASPGAMPTIDADTLQSALGRVLLIDARAGERFRGEVEPLDLTAGHIPGATLRFFKDNLGPDGRFKPAQQLHAEFAALGAVPAAAPPAAASQVAPPSMAVHQCGSGVTACHNLLAMAHADFGDTVLYPGSWSEWCSDPARPVARG